MDEKGLALSISTGLVTITAIRAVISGSASLTITPAELVSIAIIPDNAYVQVGGTKQLKALGLYSDDSTQDITTSVTWFSSNEDIAAISNVDDLNIEFI